MKNTEKLHLIQINQMQRVNSDRLDNTSADIINSLIERGYVEYADDYYCITDAGKYAASSINSIALPPPKKK